MSPPSVTLIYASGSGHTEYVFDQICSALKTANITVTMIRAEKAQAEDIQKADVIVLGSGTWNTGGSEGQLHPYMHDLLNIRLSGMDLKAKPVAFVSLGDERYYFTTRCTEYFMKFAKQSNSKLCLPPLTIVNEPYGQEEKIAQWAGKLRDAILKNSKS